MGTDGNNQLSYAGNLCQSEFLTDVRIRAMKVPRNENRKRQTEIKEKKENRKGIVGPQAAAVMWVPVDRCGSTRNLLRLRPFPFSFCPLISFCLLMNGDYDEGIPTSLPRNRHAVVTDSVGRRSIHGIGTVQRIGVHELHHFEGDIPFDNIERVLAFPQDYRIVYLCVAAITAGALYVVARALYWPY